MTLAVGKKFFPNYQGGRQEVLYQIVKKRVEARRGSTRICEHATKGWTKGNERIQGGGSV